MAELVALPSLAAIQRERQRRVDVRDPDGWIERRLGEHVWSKQKDICRSVRDNRYTAVKSCHDVGKSYIAARIAAWWLETHPVGEAFVVTSAPTFHQVRAVLWREINRAHGKGDLIGRTNQTEWWIEMPPGPSGEAKQELVGFGRKPADMDATGFQGIHARYVLVIFDEACGIPRALWDGAEGLVTNEESRWLAIGNPTDPATEFYEVCKPGSGWNVIGISAFDSPNFTDEPVPEYLRDLLISRTWQEEKLRKWGETNPLYISKVLGEFPGLAGDGLIPVTWVRLAQQREIALPTDPLLLAKLPNELGVDVGGGRDKSVIAHRRGFIVRIIKRTNTPDTMETCGHVIQALVATGATIAKVDSIGIGKGVVDRGKEQERPFVAVNVGAAPTVHEHRERFVNLRAEEWWAVRERFEAGDIDLDPEDDDLAAQLCALRFKTTSRGQIQIESKEEMRARGLESPDDADALMLSCAKKPAGGAGMRKLKGFS